MPAFLLQMKSLAEEASEGWFAALGGKWESHGIPDGSELNETENSKFGGRSEKINLEKALWKVKRGNSLLVQWLWLWALIAEDPCQETKILQALPQDQNKKRKRKLKRTMKMGESLSLWMGHKTIKEEDGEGVSLTLTNLSFVIRKSRRKLV